MDASRFAVSSAPLAVDAVIGLAHAGDPGGDGAVVVFVGRVRNEHGGQRVVALEYEAYEPMAVRMFGRIASEAATEWPGTTLAVHHRVGRLAVGDPSVVVAAASPHRAEAFAACRYAIERIKQVAPVWKREWFATGDAWVEGTPIDPGDEGARREARRRACG